MQGLYTTLQFCKSSFLCFKLPTVRPILPANPQETKQQAQKNQDEQIKQQVQGQRLLGPQQKPLKPNRPRGDVCLIDLPIRDMDSHGGKVEPVMGIIQ